MFGNLVMFTVPVGRLPDRMSRATAASTWVVPGDSYDDDDGWTFAVLCLRASGVRPLPALKGWYSRPDEREPTIGRVRTKRPRRDQPAGQRTYLYELAAFLEPIEPTEPHPVVELLDLSIEPAFMGQGLGAVLLRAALRDVPPDHLVVCEPRPTHFTNIDEDQSRTAVVSYYAGLGFQPDDRVPGYLSARRGDLDLDPDQTPDSPEAS